MLKKIIAFVILFAILVPHSPAVAADETTVTPTIEEILNGYHDKAFEASVQGENGAAATWSGRSGDSKTLEQETVEQLTAAGYEAYNVTGENYDAVADALDTDLAAMGLDPEGSYIVVISDVPPGETPDSNAGNNSRVAVPPVQEDLDDGSDSFTHVQGDDTYIMRYVTITAVTDSRLRVVSAYHLSALEGKPNYIEEIWNTVLSMVVDELYKPVPVGTVLSLLGGWREDLEAGSLVYLHPDSITIHAESVYTHSYIQVLNQEQGLWKTAQCSTYANSGAMCVGTTYDPITNGPEPVIGEFIKKNNLLSELLQH